MVNILAATWEHINPSWKKLQDFLPMGNNWTKKKNKDIYSGQKMCFCIQELY